MNETSIKKCLTCGGELVPDGRGIPTCEYCGRQYKEGVGSFSHELDEVVKRRQLREFIQAEELCKELQQKQPESSEVYWQTLLSSLGVVYVQEDGKAKPTFFSYSYDDRNLITDNENYKNAIRYARTTEERDCYEEHARELDALLKAFFNLVAKEDSYDIFISFKRTTTATVNGAERQIDTDDYLKAKEIYEYLSKKYRVFFSPVSIGQDTGIEGEKYEPRILKALQTSQAMVLLGSRQEYLEAQWVQNEWKRYQYFVSKGKKSKSSLILGYEKYMPALPVALKDIQLPSFDWFKGNYLKELENKLSFVHSSKGIRSSIRERKVNSNFETDSGFGVGYSGKRVSISGKGNADIVLSASEERELALAEKTLQGGQFSGAKNLFNSILQKNPNNAKAYWGRFKSNIKADKDGQVPYCVTENGREDYFKDVDSAIDCSGDERFSWNIVDLLIKSLSTNADWGKQKKVFEVVIKYLDDKRSEQVLQILSENAYAYLDANTRIAEDVFDTSRKLFFEENKAKALEYMRNFADGLYSRKCFDEARKYYEELASVQRDAGVYMLLLGCRVKSVDVTKTKFNLDVNPNDDASAKKPSELDLDEIIERAIICNSAQNNAQINELIKEIVLYQIVHNRKNAKPFIETVVSCYAQLKQDEVAIQFLMQIAERFIQLKDFKQAQVYYNEVLSRNPNYSKAHWGLLMCRFKVFDENQLIRKKNQLLNIQEYSNAISCANDSEFQHYTDILNGVVQYYTSPYATSKDAGGKVKNPNKRAYLHFTKVRRGLIKVAILIVCALLAAAGIYTGVGISNPISYSVDGNSASITGTNMFFNMSVSELTVDEYNGKPITEIKNGVFKGKSIKTLTLADSVTNIGNNAFENCKDLNSVTILGENVSIGDYAFANCTSLTSLTFGESNDNLSRAIGNGIVIGDYAFKNTGIEKIEITNVNSIGANVFDGCNSLKEIVLEIEDTDAVDNKAFVGLSSEAVVFVPSVSLEIYSSITKDNPSLTVKTYTVNGISECIFFINEIGPVTLDSYEAIKRAESIYDNLTSTQRLKITNYATLQSARNVYNVMDKINVIGTVTLNSNSAITTAETAYNGLTTAEKSAVSNYATLQSARKVYDVMDKINVIGTITLSSNSAITTAENGYNALTSEEKANVSNYATLQSARKVYDVMDKINVIGTVTLDSNNVISAAEVAYNGLTETEKLQINNYESLANSRNYYNYIIQFTFDLDSSNSTYSISIANRQISGEIEIPAQYNNKPVSHIANFSYCSNLTKLTIPYSVTNIGDSAFFGCSSLTSIIYTGDIKGWCEMSGLSNLMPQNTSNKTLIIDGVEINELVIPDNVTCVGSYAFYRCSSITSVTIGNSVTSIGNNAFYGCGNITNIVIPDSVVSIGRNAFYNCSSLQYNEYENGLYLGNSNNKYFVFIKTKDKSISSCTINTYAKFIYDSAFDGCSELLSIIIPNSVTGIVDYTFRNCSSLTSIGLPDSITSIGIGAFSGCSNLTSIKIPNKVTSIGNSAFLRCSSLKSVNS